MDVEQKANDVRLEADHQRLDYINFMDDEEVMLLHRKRDMDVPDNPGFRMSVMDLIRRIHNEKTTSDGASSWGSSQADGKGATSVDR